MTQTQEHLFKLLLEIDEICKKHDITFFLDYGTLLGAIRHEGFIPWDKDLDITMTEENYNKFVLACEKELDHKTRTFCDTRRNRDFPTVYGHYIDLQTCRMSGHTAFWDYYCGQWIDIFCLLELPSDKKARQEFIDFYYAYDEYCNRSFRKYRIKSDAIMKIYQEFQEKEALYGKEAVLQEAEAKIFGHHYPDCDTFMVASARGLDPSPFVPKQAFEMPQDAVFENHIFKIPGDAIRLLTLYYGDNFNRFPTDIKKYRDMSHSGVPSQAYVDDLLSVMNRASILEDRKRFKEIDVEEGRMVTEIRIPYFKAYGLNIANQLKRTIQKEKIDVDTLLKSGKKEDLLKLEKLFKNYLEKQLHSTPIYWRVYFEIGDQLEYAAMYTLFRLHGDCKRVEKLIWLREENDLPLTKEMEELKDAIKHIRNLKKYLLLHDLESAKDNLDWCLERFPDMKDIERYAMEYQVLTAETEEELTACKTTIEKWLEKYPKDQYGQKAMGDILWKQKRFTEAQEIYTALKKSSDDGMLLLDIRKKEEKKDD